MAKVTQAQTDVLRRIAVANETLALHMANVAEVNRTLLKALCASESLSPMEGTWDEIQHRAIIERLSAHNGCRRSAARSLGITERTFYRRCAQYGV